MAGTLHVPRCRCCARVEILEDQRLGQIWAPFEEPTSDGLEEGQNLGAAERLVGKLDSIGTCAHRVREGGQRERRGGCGIGGTNDVWGMIQTGAGS